LKRIIDGHNSLLLHVEGHDARQFDIRAGFDVLLPLGMLDEMIFEHGALRIAQVALRWRHAAAHADQVFQSDHSQPSKKQGGAASRPRRPFRSAAAILGQPSHPCSARLVSLTPTAEA
jgi:hypothetical protein